MISEELIDCYTPVARTVTLESFSGCPQDEKNAIHFDGSIKKSAHNKYAINGEFLLTDTIEGPIEVFMKMTNDERFKSERVFIKFSVLSYRKQMRL